MTEKQFACLQCGHCCNRILIMRDGVRMGLCLLPGEEKLFDAFPDAVLPYMALQKPGRPRMRIVAHQLVHEPCPLYDAATKTCTEYAKRPVTCKAYPFSLMYGTGGAFSIETTCTWIQAERDGIEYGKTKMQIGADQNMGVHAMEAFFMSLHDRMRRTGYTRLIMFDAGTREWRAVGEVP